MSKPFYFLLLSVAARSTFDNMTNYGIHKESYQKMKGNQESHEWKRVTQKFSYTLVHPSYLLSIWSKLRVFTYTFCRHFNSLQFSCFLFQLVYRCLKKNELQLSSYWKRENRPPESKKTLNMLRQNIIGDWYNRRWPYKPEVRGAAATLSTEEGYLY